MTDPKVSEKEMLEHLNDCQDIPICYLCDAIRAAIEERGRLRKQIKEWQNMAIKAEQEKSHFPWRRKMLTIAKELRDFGASEKIHGK